MAKDANVVICKHCGRPELWGKMIWLNDKCICRACYKEVYKSLTGKEYEWDDLEPTQCELGLYSADERMRCNGGCTSEDM